MKFCICCGCEMEDEDTFCINLLFSTLNDAPFFTLNGTVSA